MGFLIGFSTACGPYRRLGNGCSAAILGAVFVLIFLGVPTAFCLALVALSLWAGMGLGPTRGAVFGAASVAAAVGLGTVCLSLLGRILGRLLVNKQRAVLEQIEEEALDRKSDPPRPR